MLHMTISAIVRTVENLLFRKTRFAPYRATDTRYDPFYYQTVLASLRDHYCENGLSDSFEAYESLISGLRDLPNTTLVPLSELMSAKRDDRKIMALRFDIDADPETAVRLARFNARYGICASFYILHTAYYYGQLIEGVWCRNAPMIREWVEALYLAGAEVGMHIDPLNVYAEQVMDGSQAVTTELAYLRNLGARICGVVAHNSIPVYGAENFEIFAGKTVWQRRKIKVKNSRWIPLGVLDAATCGIDYEGNFATPISRTPSPEANAWLDATLKPAAANSDEWMRTYLLENPCYRREYEVCVWHHGGGKWSVAGHIPGREPVWCWKISQAEMLDVVRGMPAGITIAMVMHPIGFSADRANKTKASEAN